MRKACFNVAGEKIAKPHANLLDKSIRGDIQLNRMKIKHHMGILLSIIGFSLWAYIVLSTTVWWVNPNYEFGLFQQLPILFWASLLTFTVGILLLLEHHGQLIFFLQIIILNLMIWGTPVFVENNARVPDAWWHLGTTKTILDSSRITVDQTPTHAYLQWPGSFIFSSIILLVTKLPVTLYLRFFPLFSSMVFLLGYYVWINKIVENGLCRKVSLIAFLFLNLWLQFHVSPQAFGLMLFPLLLIGLLKRTRKWKLITIVLYASLVISHPLSPFLLILLSFGQFVVLLLLGKKSNQAENVLFLISLWLAWFVINAFLSFNSRILEAYDGLLNIARMRGTTEVLMKARIGFLPSIVRLATVISTLLIAVFHIFRSRKSQPRFTLYASWISSSFLFFFYDLSVNPTPAGVGLQDRAFMLAYLLIPLLVVEFVWELKTSRPNARTGFIAGIILLLLLPNLSTLYYSENFFIISNSNIEAISHVNEYCSHWRLYGGGHLNLLYTLNTSRNYQSLYYYSGELPVGSAIIFDPYTEQSAFAGEMSHFHDMCSKRIGANLLYSNGKFEAYFVGLFL